MYAVERTSISRTAKRIIASNGFSEVIEIVESDLEDAEIPEKVDVIVSEWMGGLGVDENMLAPVIIARNRYLKPGGKMIPARVTAVVTPSYIGDLTDALKHWRSKPHGVDMSDIAELTIEDSHLLHAPIRDSDPIAAPQVMWTHDAYECSLEEADSSFCADLKFVAERSGPISGLATWFHAEMGDGNELTNSIGFPDTHWGRLVLPLRETIEVTQGTVIAVSVKCHPAGAGHTEFEWSVKVGDAPAEHYDSAHPRGQ